MGEVVKAQVRSGWYTLDDFHQTARVAVADAVMTFDPDKGAGLTTHVVWRIRGATSHLVRTHNRVVRGSSLDAEFDGDRVSSFADELSDAGGDPAGEVEPFGGVSLKRLTPTQRYVVRRYLVEGYTMNDVADELGVSRGRVGQIWLSAVATLRGERSKRTAAENAAVYRKTKLKREAENKPCRECGRLATRARQLCSRCYVVASIRDRHPTDPKCGRRMRAKPVLLN